MKRERPDVPKPGRPRTRLTPATRRDQLMDAAAEIVNATGLASLSIKLVAQAAGISEAQVHHCFGGRHDLLVALARREIAAISAGRGLILARGSSRRTRIVVSTLNYLHEAARHGPLLQRLLRDPEVRDTLRDEWQERSSTALEPIVRNLTADGGIDSQEAIASAAALTAISLRAGGMVAARRAPFDVAERLCIAMMMAGIDSDARLVDARREAAGAALPGQRRQARRGEGRSPVASDAHNDA